MKITLTVLAIVFFATGLPSETPAVEPPNVIVVMTDDQGYGDLSCHGNPVVQTPHLDRLHAESVRLTDFHVAPMCTPTRGQLLTGIDALRNKAMNVSSGRSLLRRDLPTMADYFRASGYNTGMFGKWHLGDNYPYRPQDRGFDEAIWFASSHISGVSDYWENDYFDDIYYHGDERKKFDGYCTDVFFREAIGWMKKQAEAGKPFFTYLPLNAPHGPLFVPDKYRKRVADALEKVLDQLPEQTPQQKRSLISFLAMIENIDENMGRLEKFLTDNGLRDNTIVIFLTDNGSTKGHSYYNAGMRGAKISLWEGGHRVPCFIRWPHGELVSATDIAVPTQVQDLLPTLVNLCGLQRPEGEQFNDTKFDGANLAAVLRDADEAPDRMLCINYTRMPWSTTRATPDSAAIARRDRGAVVWKRWRLLRDKELYNLDNDPLQEHNVIDQHPEVAAKMREHYNQWWSGLEADVNVPERVVIGHDAENPTMLSPCEWFDVIVDQQRQVRAGDDRNSKLYLEVAEPGEYEFELRRWPREADLALSAGMPRTKVTDGEYIAGKALPIAKAKLQIGDDVHQCEVASGDKAARFTAKLEAGPVEVQTFFLNADDEELCGAYYLYVNRK